MGIDGPQARLQPAVERQAPFCLLILSLVKLWYLTVGDRSDELLGWGDAWYRHKDGVPCASCPPADRSALCSLDRPIRRLQVELPPEGRRLLKRKRYLLLKAKEDIGPRDRVRLEELLKVNVPPTPPTSSRRTSEPHSARRTPSAFGRRYGTRWLTVSTTGTSSDLMIMRRCGRIENPTD